MPLIWAAISGHGFGHAAQVVPVLNALGHLVPDFRTLLRTTVPASFFMDRLSIPWDVSAVQQDVGCIQDGPLTIDVDATWREHERFRATWPDRLQTELAAMQAARPDLVLADTPYLALAAGKQAGIPTVALVSLTWDLVLSELRPPSHIDREALMQSIRRAYAQTDLALRMTPAPKIDAFDNTVDIGPIAEPVAPERAQLAQALGLAPNERTVLVGFGGIPLASIPFTEIERLEGYRFLFDGPTPPDSRRIMSIRSLPFAFKTLLASVDIVMTKPGYGTIVEAVALHTPVVYVRRYNFADEQALVDYLHRHGRGVELSREDFAHARWETALRRILELPAPVAPPPAPTGALEAAALLAPYFSRTGT